MWFAVHYPLPYDRPCLCWRLRTASALRAGLVICQAAATSRQKWIGRSQPLAVNLCLLWNAFPCTLRSCLPCSVTQLCAQISPPSSTGLEFLQNHHNSDQNTLLESAIQNNKHVMWCFLDFYHKEHNSTSQCLCLDNVSPVIHWLCWYVLLGRGNAVIPDLECGRYLNMWKGR